MKMRYIQNENCYLITSFADPNNPIFTSKEDQKDFMERAYKYLSPVGEILGYAFHADQFQVLIHIKSRKDFVTFYNKKHKTELKESEVVESTYIFSQQIANMLSGYAKTFNKKHGRFGALFGRRFTKILIESEDEIQAWILRMHAKERYWKFEQIWSYVRNFVKSMKQLGRIQIGLGIMNAKDLEAVEVDNVLKLMLISFESFKLRGMYVVKPLPPHLASKIFS